MPTNCSICVHPSRSEIDAELVRGASVRDAAGRWGLSKSAVARHKKDHIPEAIAQAQQVQQARLIEHGGTLLEQVEAIKAEAHEIMNLTKSSPDKKTALMAMTKMLDCLELMAKVQGKISDGASINLTVSPEWARTRELIVAALAPYPDARQAVAAALQTLNPSNAGA